jgi:hypothetical protein
MVALTFSSDLRSDALTAARFRGLADVVGSSNALIVLLRLLGVDARPRPRSRRGRGLIHFVRTPPTPAPPGGKTSIGLDVRDLCGAARDRARATDREGRGEGQGRLRRRRIVVASMNQKRIKGIGSLH